MTALAHVFDKLITFISFNTRYFFKKKITCPFERPQHFDILILYRCSNFRSIVYTYNEIVDNDLDV